MKSSTSILTTIALLAVATLNLPGAHAEPVPDNIDADNLLPTAQPPLYEKSLPPHRALRTMGSPQQQEPLADSKKKHHHQHHPNKDNNTKQGPRILFEEEVANSVHRILGQPPAATPALSATADSTTAPVPSTPRVTPAGTKPNSQKSTPCPHSQKNTNAPSKSPTHNSTPPATKAPATKSGTPAPANKGFDPVVQKSRMLGDHTHKITTNSGTPSPTIFKGFGPVVLESRMLGDDQVKQNQSQSPPCDHNHGGKPGQKNGKHN